MKKNNKFRNNNNNSNNNVSLNNKFDSVSPAGKMCGTALDLIKRYNDLAKEAHGTGDYVQMEVFRQYAEHYRKIVTEINERKAAQQEFAAAQTAAKAAAQATLSVQEESNKQMNTDSAKEASCSLQGSADEAKAETTQVATLKPSVKTKPKAFTVIEIRDSKDELTTKETASEQAVIVQKKTCTRRKVQKETTAIEGTNTATA